MLQELESSSLELILYSMLAFAGSKFSLVDTKYAHPVFWNIVTCNYVEKSILLPSILISEISLPVLISSLYHYFVDSCGNSSYQFV